MEFLKGTFSDLVQRLGRETALQIVDDLFQRNVLSREEMNTITTERVSQELARRLVLMVLNKGNNCCSLFVKFLETHDQSLFQHLQGNCEMGASVQAEFESLAGDLKDLYKSPGFRQFYPLGDETGIDILFDLENTFTDPLLWRKDIHNRRLDHLHLEAFLQEFDSPCIIEGEAGKGKTTLLKRIATLWARGCIALQKYQLVFFISLSSARDGIYETLCDQILGLSHGWNKVSFMKQLQTLKGKVLFLLDGYDEFNSENCAELDALIKENYQYKYAVAVTTRTETIRQVRRFGSLVVETGDLTEKSAEMLIKNVLVDQQADELLHQLNDSIFMKNLMKTPLFVVIACALRMGDSTSVLNTQTTLFRTLYDLMVERNKHKTENVASDCIAQSITQCGDLALSGVINLRFDFQETDLASVQEQVLLASGLLHKYTAQRLRPVYRFFHKSFQEYTAGRRLSDLLESDNEVEVARGENFLRIIESVSEVTTKYGNLLMYACGSSKHATIKVVKHLANIYPQGNLLDPSFASGFVDYGIDLFYESTSQSDLGEEFRSLFSGKTMYINTQSIPAHYFDFFSYLPNCLSALNRIKLDFFGNSVAFPDDIPLNRSDGEKRPPASETYIPKRAVDLFFDWNQELSTLEVTLKDFSNLNKKDIKYLGKICCSAARLSLHIKKSPAITDTLTQVLESCRNMQDLTVEGTSLSLEDEQRIVEMTAMKTLTILNLQTERLKGGLIDGMGKLVNIEKLILDDVKMEEADAAQLAIGIRNLKNLKVLQLLHLPNVAEGLHRIIESVTFEPCALEDVTLVDCGLSGNTVITLANNLSNLPNLTVLNLSENHLQRGGKEAVEILVDRLHNVPGVTTLMLPWGSDVNLCMDRLVEQLKRMPQLQKLSLRKWSLWDVEIQKLSLLFTEHLNGLLHLDLGENCVQNQGWSCLFGALYNQKHLTYFDFSTADIFTPYPKLVMELKRLILALQSLMEIQLNNWDLDEIDREVIDRGKKGSMLAH